MPASELNRLLQKVAKGSSLDEAEMATALETMSSGDATPDDIVSRACLLYTSDAADE